MLADACGAAKASMFSIASAAAAVTARFCRNWRRTMGCPQRFMIALSCSIPIARRFFYSLLDEPPALVHRPCACSRRKRKRANRPDRILRLPGTRCRRRTKSAPLHEGGNYDNKMKAAIREAVKRITGKDATDVAGVCCNEQHH